MGIASGDFDGDGDEDLFVTNIAGETFALYANDGHGNFEDVRTRCGPGAADRGVHRLRHRLVRLRQRRLARPVRRQRRGQRHRGAARTAASVPHDATSCSTTTVPADSKSARRRADRRSRGRTSAAAPRSATSTTTATSTSSSPTTAVPLRLLLNRGQPGKSLADGQPSTTSRATASRWARGLASSASAGRRSGAGSRPTAATCQRVTFASISDSAAPRAWTPCW